MKLTKELAYMIGFWKMRSTREGIGVVGGPETRQKFVLEILKLKLTTPEKFFLDENFVLFHHIKYRRFFLDVAKNQDELFARKNKLTVAYVRGMYDSRGKFEKKLLTIENTTFQDQMLIERLGFYTERKGGILRIRNPEEFLKFLEKYSNLK